MYAKQLLEALSVLDRIGHSIDPSSITSCLHVNVATERRTTIIARTDTAQERLLICWTKTDIEVHLT